MGKTAIAIQLSAAERSDLLSLARAQKTGQLLISTEFSCVSHTLMHETDYRLGDRHGGRSHFLVAMARMAEPGAHLSPFSRITMLLPLKIELVGNGANLRKYLPFVAAFAILAMLPTDASAWSCRASSPTGGWGWGRAVCRGVAGRIALNNCADRTPRAFVCFINFCTPRG